VGNQRERGLGWDLPKRLGRALGVCLAPGVDAVDEQIAARCDQRDRGK
jgi:hypothetical protein